MRALHSFFNILTALALLLTILAVVGALGSLGDSAPPFAGPCITAGDPIPYGLLTLVFALAGRATKSAPPSLQ